ncbi:hypothetical protein ASD80_16820 [Devosia sp. Root635]|nr:hypothetical protein ASD80_16820 [Devosia sp. Root635]
MAPSPSESQGRAGTLRRTVLRTLRECQEVIRLHPITLGLEVFATVAFMNFDPNGVVALVYRPEAVFFILDKLDQNIDRSVPAAAARATQAL